MNHRNILFVGLGGHGGRIVTEIKNRLSEYETRNNLHYLLIDLERFHNLGNTSIGESEYLFFGGINPKQYVNDITNKGIDSDSFERLNQYFPIDQSYFLDSLPNRPLEKGAGRKRMIGRLMLYSKKQNIENRVNDLLRKLDSKKDISSPNVVVISSSCGGTGSSIFYDILNLFSSPSINLFPVVIGPSMLVEKNKEVNIQLANKIKMNAMAFFEELNFYNRFPKYNFSFFSNKASSLNLRYIIFFDNFLSETSRIANTNLGNFENYIANCVSLLFNGEYKSSSQQVTQDIWANIENISDDMLNELREIKSNAVSGLLEQNNFISFGFSENKSQQNHLLDVLEVLLDDSSIKEDTIKLNKNELLQTVEPKLFSETNKNDDPWKNLEREFVGYRGMSVNDIYSKYIERFVSNVSTPPSIDKLASLETIKDYLVEVNSKIPLDKKKDLAEGVDTLDDENEDEDGNKGAIFIKKVVGFLTGKKSDTSKEIDLIEDSETNQND